MTVKTYTPISGLTPSLTCPSSPPLQVLSILTNTMALLRRCRVNAALTIQLFSQLFHFINMWVFNRIVADSLPNYCTR